MVPTKTTIALVGGGPVGLVSSILLSLQGIEHVVFERQPDTSIHPKAVGLNQRTIEIFRKLGVADKVLRNAAPASMSEQTAWHTSFGPNGREIRSRYAWGGGPYQKAFEDASPCPYAQLPQIRLEPILKQRALQLNPEGVFYSHEVDHVVEEDDHVSVKFHERRQDEENVVKTIAATYVLGADGGRALADQLDVRMNGPSDIVDMVSAHIRSPISRHRPNPNIFIHWFISPELGGSLKTGYLYHLGPYPMQTDTEEWCFACARLPHEQIRPFTEEDMIRRLHQTLQIPNLEVDLLSLSHWHVNAQVADQYRSRKGRIFLVGDAAHRVPPWGALGLNSGIQDVDNLIWKLALALKNPALGFEKLLNSYDGERRPIGERVAKTSLYNMQAHALVLDHALGLSPDKSEEYNVQAMEQYFDASDSEGKSKRKEVDKAMEVLDVEFSAHGAEVGWFYDLDYDGEHGLVGTAEPNPQVNQEDGEMELCVYHPSTRPGSQLPHAWLIDEFSFVNSMNAQRISTRELVEKDKLLLLAMNTIWRRVEHPFVKTVIIDLVDNDKGDYVDVDDVWKQVCGDKLGRTGALLVRPDNIVAYRFWNHAIITPRMRYDFSNVVETILKLTL